MLFGVELATSSVHYPASICILSGCAQAGALRCIDAIYKLEMIARLIEPLESHLRCDPNERLVYTSK
jgi:hypothetical protein